MIDLKETKDAKNNDIGNFDCRNLIETMKDDIEPQFVLFGNDPRAYIPLKQTSKKSLIKAFKIDTKKKKLSLINESLGQIDWDRDSKTLSNYFASASCQLVVKNRVFTTAFKYSTFWTNKKSSYALLWDCLL